MSKLLPCPFCGSDEINIRAKSFTDGSFLTWIECALCLAQTPRTNDLDAAVEAWNTRADDYRQAAEYWQRMYEEAFAEWTCHDRNASAREHGAHLFMWRCSNCDESYDTEMDKLNYCPNCGAKVVKSVENSD